MIQVKMFILQVCRITEPGVLCCQGWLSILGEVTAGAVLLSRFDNIIYIDTHRGLG